MGFVKKTGSILKSYPFFYSTGLKIYKIIFACFAFLFNAYLNVVEFLLPENYFIQSVPDYAKGHYKDFIKDQKIYNCRQQLYYNRDGNRILNSKYLLDMVYPLP